MNGSWNWEIPPKKEFLNPRHPNTSWVTICVWGKFKSMNVYDVLSGEIEVAERQVLLLADPEISRSKQAAMGVETPERPRWIKVVHSIRNHPENRESGSSSKIRNGMDFWWFQNREDGFDSFPFNNESGEWTYWRRLSSPTWQDGFFPAFLGICWAESVFAWQCLGGCSLIRGWWWFKGQSGWGCSVWRVDSGVAFHHAFFFFNLKNFGGFPGCFIFWITGIMGGDLYIGHATSSYLDLCWFWNIKLFPLASRLPFLEHEMVLSLWIQGKNTWDLETFEFRHIQRVTVASKCQRSACN